MKKRLREVLEPFKDLFLIAFSWVIALSSIVVGIVLLPFWLVLYVITGYNYTCTVFKAIEYFGKNFDKFTT